MCVLFHSANLLQRLADRIFFFPRLADRTIFPVFFFVLCSFQPNCGTMGVLSTTVGCSLKPIDVI